MKQVTIDAYQYAELDDKAKERARDWYRKGLQFDHDPVLEDARSIYKILGITLDTRGIAYSGFCSQGDGASFTGTWSYRPEAVAEIRDYAPNGDGELLAIAELLEKAQGRDAARLTANVTRRSYQYCHDYTVDIDVSDEIGEAAGGAAAFVETALRELMRWTYRQLEREHDWQMSDEAVTANIEANEYAFTKGGKRFPEGD